MWCKEEPLGDEWCRLFYRADALPVTNQQCQSTEGITAYTTQVIRWNTDSRIRQWLQLKGSVKEPSKFHTMKLRKSLVKPVMRQNISSCLVLPPEIVMHDAFNVILWTSTDICVVVHDNLGWKNRITRYTQVFCRITGFTSDFRKHPPIYTSCMTISGDGTEQHIIIGFGELAAVD